MSKLEGDLARTVKLLEARTRELDALAKHVGFELRFSTGVNSEVTGG